MQTALREANPIMAPHWKLTAEDYHRMAEVGILHEDDRVELIEGELIQMTPIGPWHSGLANTLVDMLAYQTRGRAIASVQNPIHLGPGSEPQPDFVLLRHRRDRYKSRLPTSADVLLLVEIADSTLNYDRRVKIPLYARHNIPEYWIINQTDRQIEVFAMPDPALGHYADCRIVAEGQLSPSQFPDINLDVAELLS
jgi:Uma2 family endonuclease